MEGSGFICLQQKFVWEISQRDRFEINEKNKLYDILKYKMIKIIEFSYINVQYQKTNLLRCILRYYK